jgi:hypothetical protein
VTRIDQQVRRYTGAERSGERFHGIVDSACRRMREAPRAGCAGAGCI